MNVINAVILLATFLFTPASDVTQEDQQYETIKISDKIIAVVDPADGTDQLAIASEKGIVVLDSLWSQIPARNFKEAIAEAFGRDDFAYVINLVDRLDLIGGNAVYSDTKIIGHESFYEKYSEDAVNSELKRLIDMWREKEQIARERQQGEAWTQYCKRHAEELEQGFSLVLPTISYKDRMTLYLGDLTLKLIYFGKAGYNGMTVLIIPEEHIAIIPGFILHGQHLAPHPQPEYTELDVPRWIAVFEEILGDDSPVEKVICDTRHVWSKERALTHLNYIRTLWERVTAAELEGLTLDEVQKVCSMDGEFSFVKDMQEYKDNGDEWIRWQHVFHVRGFYLQHKKIASEILRQIYLSSSMEAVLAKFNEMRDAGGEYYFDEASFNAMGYYLLNEGKTGDAIEVFKMNVLLFPQSANVYDSLGEAYMKDGDRDAAIENYRKALELNPENDGAKANLKKLLEQQQK